MIEAYTTIKKYRVTIYLHGCHYDQVIVILYHIMKRS